jgi:hypothetical protein
VESGDGGRRRGSRGRQVLLVGAVNCHLGQELPLLESGLGGALGGEVARIGAWELGWDWEDLPWVFAEGTGREEKARFEFRGKILGGEEWRERMDLCFLPFLVRGLHEPANLENFRGKFGGDRDLGRGGKRGSGAR